MFQIKVNNQKDFRVEKKNNEWLINDQIVSFDLVKVKEGMWHLLKDHRSYTVELIKLNKEEKKLLIRVNGTKYDVQLSDKYDVLLKQMGMDTLAGKKVNEVKAPMPGLVLNILVEEGREVKKGDALLVLEAMKMENVLKSPADGIVRKVNVNKGTAVEKNQVLILF